MKKYIVKIPFFIPWIYPKRVWHFSRKQKAIYFTFDDGPIPEVTPWVLDQLNKHQAKATFFCIGQNVEKHPEIFKHIQAEGHAVGNHTFNHLNATETSVSTYLENTEKAHSIINHSLLFRPPYGKLDSAKEKALIKKGYKIVMWDVLSADFDPNISPQECFSNVIKNAKNGSIIIFHDSIKAEKKLKYTLPKALKYFKEKGFEFKAV